MRSRPRWPGAAWPRICAAGPCKPYSGRRADMSASPAFDLTDKVAVVSGALGLLGREHCAALAAARARVVVTDLSADGLGALAERLVEGGARDALAVPADITQPGDVDRLR